MDEERIFLHAVELAEPTERTAFLDEACGNDPALQSGVESLLRHHAAATRFLETPPTELQATIALDQAATVEIGTRDRTLELLSPSDKPGCLGQLGAYEVLEVIGRGGMGVVLKARDPKLQRDVAIKLMAMEGGRDPESVRRFLREAQAAAAVKHDHVVTIHAIHDDGLRPYLVMELIEGLSLQQRISQCGPLPVGEILRIGSQIAAGLEAAHQRGLVHRDIKPANILLEMAEGQGLRGEGEDEVASPVRPSPLSPQPSAFRVKITDFGLARAVDDSSLSREGMIAGTPQFMSPEQAQGRKADHRSDLFSLGSVLYAMCVSRPAFSAETTLATLRRIIDDVPPPVRDSNPHIPAWLDQLIAQLLEKEPEKRPQSACEVFEELVTSRIPADAESTSRNALASGSATLSTARQPDASAFRLIDQLSQKPPGSRRTLVALMAGGVLLAGVILLIKSRDGKTTKIDVPPGANVTVKAEGAVEVDLSGTGRDVADGSNETNGRAEDEDWLRSVSSMSGVEQVVAVGNRLKELNPGFGGQVKSTMEFGTLVRLEFVTDEVTNISPLRALTKLRTLVCMGSGGEQPGRLEDLSPLRGLSLTSLHCGRTRVADLTPLKGMPLETLDCSDSQVRDLSPLAEMPLRHLGVHSTRVTDLSPLKELPLISLNCSNTTVTDFSPLKNVRLEALICDQTRVADLSPLRDMPLRTFNWRGYDYRLPLHREVVKSLSTLENINSLPVAEFWKEHGE